MMSEEDSRLFEAAKRAQVNRNTAIHIIDNARASDILAGSFVRVLLEMPSRHEGYMVARIQGTSTGEPYSGFSTNAAQMTSIYLMLELPPALAAINGVQYQLNSVSNSIMGEGEFREWLSLIRSEPSLRVPTVQQLEEVGNRIRPFEVSRHRSSQQQNLASSSDYANNNNNNRAAAGRSLSQNNLQQRALSARAQGRQLRQNPSGSAAGLAPPPLPMPGGRSPTASSDMAMMHSPGGGSDGTRGSVTTNAAPSSSGADGNYNANRYVRQSTVMARDFNRNPREDGQASNDLADADGGTAGGEYMNGNANNNNGHRSVSPRPSGNAGPASAAAIPFMTRGAADHRMESEDEELERRLRQDILNHLAQECVLFPTDSTSFKLSRLRLLERDMIEYLQHVRDEIQGKQENCIVCMDHVPTVILLPCKHKVMCRLCAPSVSQCPVCRSQIAEMFEPEEI